MKCEEDKETSHRHKEKQKPGQGENGAASEFTSTFHSIDLPPKEYEQQLQQYESDVRNHIRAEQQLKLHIEVLQEKIDDFEKEKEQFDAKLAEQKTVIEKKLKAYYTQIIDQKKLEIDRLNKELAKQLDFANGSIEQTLSADPKLPQTHHTTS